MAEQELAPENANYGTAGDYLTEAKPDRQPYWILPMGLRGSGKSAFCERYIYNHFDPVKLDTDVIYPKTIQVGKRKVPVNIPDLSRYEQVPYRVRHFVRCRADGFLFLFDLTTYVANDATWEFWINEFLELIKSEKRLSVDKVPHFVLVGTKADMLTPQNLKKASSEMQLLAEKLKTNYYETTAFSDEQIREAVEDVLKQVLKREDKIKKSGKCCTKSKPPDLITKLTILYERSWK